MSDPTFSRIKDIASARSLSLNRLAIKVAEAEHRAKARPATIINIANGNTSPDIRSLVSIARVLGVKPFELFDDAPWPDGVPDTRQQAA